MAHTAHRELDSFRFRFHFHTVEVCDLTYRGISPSGLVVAIGACAPIHPASIKAGPLGHSSGRACFVDSL